MIDMSHTIVPKSDQMNADDLIAGPITVKISKVSADTGSAEQPILVHYEGDGGKPYKPCKSMRRVMVAIWGSDGSQYAGRSMRLYRDPSVKWGGMEVGGIRISHMSHMETPITMALTATKQSRKPFTVQPLVIDPVDTYADEVRSNMKSAATADDLIAWWKSTEPRRAELKIPAARLTNMNAAVTKRVEELKNNPANPGQ